MVIDTSVIVAIALTEPDADQLKRKIDGSSVRVISVGSMLEAAIVLQTKFGRSGGQRLDLLIAQMTIDVIGIDINQLRWARHALETYGRGQHAANSTSAIASHTLWRKSAGEPLLFKGGDFAHTDIAVA